MAIFMALNKGWDLDFSSLLSFDNCVWFIMDPIYKLSPLLLMWITGRLLAYHFEGLSRNIVQMRTEDFLDQPDTVAHQWKRQYTALCDGVRHWNTFFGVVLLMHVSGAVLEITFSSFYAVYQLFNAAEMIVPVVVSWMLSFTSLWITCHVVHSIYDRSEDVGRALIHLECRLARPSPLIDRLAAHVIQSSPEISAAGFFKIHRNLYPSVSDGSFYQ